MENKIENLIEEVLGEYDLPNVEKVNVQVEADDESFKITISGNFEVQKEKEFKNWCQTLDDDLFVEACERFESLTGIALKDVEDYDMFKQVVKQIAQEKIQKLQNYVK